MAGPNDFNAILNAILSHTGQTALYPPGDLLQNPAVSATGLAAGMSGFTNMGIVGMLVGAGLESNWTINAKGGGAFQIIHSMSGSPTDINAAVANMWPAYLNAAIADAAKPEGSAKYADIAYKAERPALPYAQGQSQARVDAVYQTVLSNYGAANATGSGASTVAVGANAPGAGFLGPVLNFLSQLTDIRVWRSLGWVSLGALLFIIGLLLWLRKPIEHAVGTVAKAAAL